MLVFVSGFWKVNVAQLCLDSMRPPGLWPTRLLCPWDFSGKNTRVGSHSLLWGIFLTQEPNPGLLHCRRPLPYFPSDRSIFVVHGGPLGSHLSLCQTGDSCWAPRNF